MFKFEITRTSNGYDMQLPPSGQGNLPLNSIWLRIAQLLVNYVMSNSLDLCLCFGLFCCFLLFKWHCDLVFD